MNTARITARLFSFAMAALITGSMLAGIDTLARGDHAASSLLAKAPTLAKTPA
jgi:hypothetical protein